MTKETEVALAAIDALCKKRKAKVLRKLVLAAVKAEGTPWNIGTIDAGAVATGTAWTSTDVSTDITWTTT